MAHALETNVRKHSSLGHLNHERHEINDSIIHMSYHIYISISCNISHKKNLNHCCVLPRLDTAIRRLKTLTPTLAHRQRKISWDQIGMEILNENPEDMYVRMSIGRCQLPSIESIYTYWTRHAPVMETFWAWEVCPVLSLAALKETWRQEGEEMRFRADNWHDMVRYDKIWYEMRWDEMSSQQFADFGL